MLTRRLVLSSLLQLVPATAALAGYTPAPKDAYLYIIWPTDGERIKGAFWCRFGLRNMGVTHAGDRTANMGHHHLLIDVDEPLDLNQPIPADKKHMHSAQAKPRCASNCNPACTRSSSCWATRSTSRSIRPLFRGKSG